MYGEKKFLRLKDDLRIQTSESMKALESGMKAAKWSFFVVTALIMLLLIVTEKPVFIMFVWTVAMLIIAGCLTVMSYFSGELQARFGSLSREDYEEDEEYAEEYGHEEPEAPRKAPSYAPEYAEYDDDDDYESVLAAAKRVVSDK